MRLLKIVIVLGIFLILTASQNGIKTEFSEMHESKEIEKVVSMHIGNPVVIENKNYAKIFVENASYYTIGNAPSLPVITKTLVFPFGSKIKDVSIEFGIDKIKINKKLTPSPKPIPLGAKSYEMKLSSIYSRDEFYPQKWYFYNIGAGLKDGQHVIFLAMKIFPCRYNAVRNEIEYMKDAKIKIRYEEGSMNFNNAYDLLIIAPSKWQDVIQPLVQHKENHGIRTKFMSVKDIVSTYNGRDDAEKVKYAIKDEIEKDGIKYVLLFGGMKRQSMRWWVPVRYSHLDDNSSWEASYLSDLYFADVYKYEDGKLVFDDWDSNGNGIFAEWNKNNKDVLDLYPDVYVGRLACRNKIEAKSIVEKIITYENSNAKNEAWFKKFVTIGGDSFPDEEVGTDYIEGQVENEQAIKYMDGFDAIRIWVEGGDVEFTPENAVNILSQGAGFVYFSGHGNPASWATHPHNDFSTWIDFSLSDIKSLSNDGKLPVLVVGGCHNCQFNVSIFKFLQEGIWAYYLGDMAPACWGWQFLRNGKGGSIATIGNTGLGYGTIGDGPVDEIPDSVPDGIPDCIQYLDGWLEPHFFEVYNHGGKHVLGEAFEAAITDYINRFPINWEMDWKDNPHTADLVNLKTVQEWVLFGDPSLQIGGY